jgi:hypothetical protein
MNARTISPPPWVTWYRPVIHWALVKLALLGPFTSKATFTNKGTKGPQGLPLLVWQAFWKCFLLDELTLLFGRPVYLVVKEGLRNPIRMDRIPATRRVIHVIGQSGHAHGTSASTWNL